MVDGSTLAILVALFGAGAVAAIIFTLLYPYLSGEKQSERRVASVSETRTKSSSTRSAAELAANRKKQITETLKDLESKQRAKDKPTLRIRLERAGLKIEPKTYWIMSVLCGVGCAVFAYFSLAANAIAPLAAAIALFIGTLGVPRFVVSKMTKRRQAKFTSELANSIDVIVRGVKSGLPLGECLQIIARESPEPIASEFREVVEQQRVGVPLSEALERLATRMPLSEVKFFTIVIAIQQQAGGNLSEALGNLSGVLRDRFRMAMKVKALSAEAKSSAAVLASLPPGVMFMVYGSAPDYIEPLFTTRTGTLFIIGGLMWMTIGVLVMRKMINFKY